MYRNIYNVHQYLKSFICPRIKLISKVFVLLSIFLPPAAVFLVNGIGIELVILISRGTHRLTHLSPFDKEIENEDVSNVNADL